MTQTTGPIIDLNAATAIEIIRRSILMHPSLFAEALNDRLRQDQEYKIGKIGRARKAVEATANATSRAISLVEAEDAEDAEAFAVDMAAGIIALNIACKLQCIPPHVRTNAALRTWEQAA